MEFYKYHLLTAASEIRALRLLPGSSSDPLRGILITVNLNTPTTYKCLSYTWGTPDLNCQIEVGAKVLPITKNLHSALHRLRSNSCNVDIWVDAICINQADVDERNSQVQMMRRIYSGCVECLIYLGEEYDDSETIPDFLQTLYKNLKILFDEEEITGFQSVPLPSHNYWKIIPPLSDPGWRALTSFLLRPWFQRIWIIQEFVLPRKVTMVCGRWRMDATLLGGVLMHHNLINSNELFRLAGNSTLAHSLLQSSVLIQAHAHLRSTYGNVSTYLDQAIINPPLIDTGLSLLELLKRTNTCKWSDPRDRFFGVFGLANDLDSLGLMVDYAKREEDIISDVSRNLIQRGHGLTLLAFAWHAKDKEGTVASWLPFWIVKYKVCLLFCGFRNRNNIASPAFDNRLPIVCLISGSNMISLKGYILDSIAELAPELPEYGEEDHDTYMHHLLAVLKRHEFMITDSKILRTEQNQLDSYWRTITGNFSRQKIWPIPASIGQEYESFHIVLKRLWEDLEDSAKRNKIAEEFDRNAGHYREFMRTLGQNSDGRFCITKSGIMALVPRTAQVGDSILTVHGDPNFFTFTIRALPDTSHYLWIGESYVHCVRGDEYQEIEEGEPVEIVIC